jgi:hypothetical protein
MQITLLNAMNHTVKTLSLVSGLLLATAAQASVPVIAFWNFNSGSAATSGTYDGSTTLAVTVGSGSLAFSGTTGITVFGGTVTNLLQPDPDGTGRGVALAIQGGTDLVNNGASLTFTLDLTGREDLGMSFAAQRTSTGFNSTVVDFSVDGGDNWTNFGSIPLFEGSMGTTSEVAAAIRNVDFSSINNSIAGVAEVRIRLTLDGSTSNTGNNRFDNVTFTAVPEPSTYAALAGLLALGLVIARRRRA